ncbi:hypothetical protein HBI56_038820 [Parastagonospora nodorum]|uniref:Uncharacterized protein n=1 Tax=Phaeosphaeria nodorum (strain SN15 / ATCC MYA-4574 / FGSC 10173) TaxID=321614 RepID=A0A7U2EUY8_PHANO|nr:hypothetical protein HBH56_067970 [Parastagonospora nodorum]QRC93474.1 hypothetical protein JI435_403900 [Parastagonospora nodorum SN15]KAH3932630.1 hypothetical protein HBH54_080140 [Parastagonospora nodorum]KAH3954653.1 hypothetical protein HBH53_014270 [Parastagonospora nodorum]KAH3986301.1 hypothetical protein HBH52_045450 [Parastagonospora nodorum]
MKTYTTKDLSRIQPGSDTASQQQCSSKRIPSFLDLQTRITVRDGTYLLRLRRILHGGHETALSLRTPPLHGLLETQPHPWEQNRQALHATLVITDVRFRLNM